MPGMLPVVPDCRLAADLEAQSQKTVLPMASTQEMCSKTTKPKPRGLPVALSAMTSEAEAPSFALGRPQVWAASDSVGDPSILTLDGAAGPLQI